MPWTIEYTDTARKSLAALDKQVARKILNYLDSRIATDENPRRFGKGLTGKLSGLWRYRVGDYRVIAEIQDGRLVVLAVRIGHRSKVYN